MSGLQEHLSADTFGWTWTLLRTFPAESREVIAASGRAWTKRGALRAMHRERRRLED